MRRLKAPVLAGLLGAALCATVGFALAAPAEKPTAGKQVHFPTGTWSALPQVGPDGKVRQCVLVALRTRAGGGGDGIETRFSINISRGAGLALALGDPQLPSEDVLDDQAEVIVGDRTFPA